MSLAAAPRHSEERTRFLSSGAEWSAIGNLRPVAADLPFHIPPQTDATAKFKGEKEPLALLMLTVVAAFSLGAYWIIWLIRRRGLQRWLPAYAFTRFRRRRLRRGQPVHLLLCIADHFEPKHAAATAGAPAARVRSWVENYPQFFGGFRDSSGRPPRHTFFYPMEKYERADIEALASLCHAGFGEVEIHLHHEGDTAQTLQQRLLEYKALLGGRHGLLARHAQTGALAYGFVHGDWALDNSHPKGRRCGVNNELSVLHETGCYADFTLPAAPEPQQTRKINSIYYAVGAPGRAKSHDTGTDVGAGLAPANGLMIIQGPLVLDWTRRKWGVLPRIENACIQWNQPATVARIPQWLRARVQVAKRPDWFFVKLHTHGAPEWNQKVLLGEPMVKFHQALATLREENPDFHFHYVTAREMYNLARAAEMGWQGSVAEVLDYELVWNGASSAAQREQAASLADALLDPGTLVGCTDQVMPPGAETALRCHAT